MVTGIDPRSLGGQETAASALGFSASDAYALQSIAWQTIQVQAVPEPSTWAMLVLGSSVLGVAARRRRRATETSPA